MVIACARPHRLAECVAPLAEAAPGCVEVVAAGDVAGLDPGSLPVTVRLIPVEERHTNVRRNAALAATTAPLVAFLDDDAVPQPGWVEAALAVDPQGSVIVTGPEIPTRGSATAVVLHAAASLPLAEGTRAHVAIAPGPVRWWDVPFCNCVVPRWVLDEVGPPAEDIPWDADDLELFRRTARVASHRNDPRLLVAHDRYPDRVGAHLAEKARDRWRTGAKIIELPQVYGEVPGVVAAALAAPVALLAAVAAGRHRARVVVLGGALYLTAAVLAAAPARRRVGWRRVPRVAAVAIAVQIITVVAVPLGALAAAFRRRGSVSRSGRGVGARRGGRDPVRPA